MKKGKVTGLLIECPHCDGENEISKNELGDTGWQCQYSHCLEKFEIPSVEDVKRYAENPDK